MHTLQQDQNKSVLSMMTHPGHQKTEIPVFQNMFATHKEVDDDDSDESEEVKDDERIMARKDYFNTLEASKIINVSPLPL